MYKIICFFLGHDWEDCADIIDTLNVPFYRIDRYKKCRRCKIKKRG